MSVNNSPAHVTTLFQAPKASVAQTFVKWQNPVVHQGVAHQCWVGFKPPSLLNHGVSPRYKTVISCEMFFSKRC